MPNVDRGADVVTCYEGMDGYALVDKAPYEWMKKEIERLRATIAVVAGGENENARQLRSENEQLRLTIEDYKRDAAIYMSAIDDADDMAKQSVQKQMAELRAENARLKRQVDVLDCKRFLMQAGSWLDFL